MSRFFLLAIIALAALASPGSKAVGSNPEPMRVTLYDNRFDPAALNFESGKTYALNLVNQGHEMHEFTAPAFLKAAIIANRSVLANGGTDIVIPPGQSVTVILTAPLPGDYELTCADHDWDGMAGHIVVR